MSSGGGGSTGKIAYTGAYTATNVTVGDAVYTQYELIGSGTLTVKSAVQGAAIWLCGGGSAGGNGLGNGFGDGYGGGGGYFTQQTGMTLAAGNYTVVVGAASGASSVTKDSTTVLTANGASGKNGGSGGGGYGFGGTAGSGTGSSSVPFSDTVNFTAYPCAGGGGGGSYETGVSSAGGYSYNCGNGGAGGTNGGNGTAGGAAFDADDASEGMGGAGGATGGGAGSQSNRHTSGSGTYYGAGGGGTWASTSTRHGAGYQGVVFVRIPA